MTPEDFEAFVARGRAAQRAVDRVAGAHVIRYLGENGLPTFEIHAVAGRAAIRCLSCGLLSQLPGDVEHEYCGRCHLFHASVASGQRLHREGATHDCAEWSTPQQVCAVCGALLGPR